jgi:uncharacterized protein
MATALRRDEHSAEFFDGTARGELLLRITPDGRFLPPDARLDPEDPDQALTWVTAAGTGRLISWIVGRGRPDADGHQAVGGVAGLGVLDEGPWVQGPIIADDPGTLVAGAVVRVTFPSVEEGEVAPAFVVT